MRWTLIATVILMIATCGQKGPLYLPDQSQTGFDRAQASFLHGESG